MVRRSRPVAHGRPRPRAPGITAAGVAAAVLGVLGVLSLACGPAGGPNAGDTTPAVSPEAAAADTAGTDGAAAGRYFVRLRNGADPVAVARRHGLVPLDTIRSPVPALYVSLTAAERDSLARDTLVVSVAREIHQGDSTPAPPIRGVPTGGPDTTDGGH